jgi:hypothetical protein
MIQVKWYWHEQAWGIHHASLVRFDGTTYRQIVVNIGPLNVTVAR